MKPKALLSWSSGKDSAGALHLLRQSGDVEVVGLVPTINETFDRVAMHGVRKTLVEVQAAAADLPLWVVPLPWPCSNVEYEERIRSIVATSLGFGLQSSDNDPTFGMNTPAYFAADNLRLNAVPEPSTLVLSLGWLFVALRRNVPYNRLLAALRGRFRETLP